MTTKNHVLLASLGLILSIITLASELYVYDVITGYGGTLLKGIIVYGIAFCLGMTLKRLFLKENQAKFVPVIIVAWTLAFLALFTSFMPDYNIFLFVLFNWFIYPALLWGAIMLGDSFSVSKGKELIYLVGIFIFPVAFLRLGVFLF